MPSQPRARPAESPKQADVAGRAQCPSEGVTVGELRGEGGLLEPAKHWGTGGP